MNHNLSIRHLRAFVAVAESSSFTQAANHLHLTQSSLTATIKQLEEQVGIRLLDRTTRSVSVSIEGQNFLPVAKQLLSDFDTSITDLQAIAAGQSGHISIAASPSIISQLLPNAVKAFQKQFPNMTLRLIDDNAAGIEQRVMTNEVDFGLGSDHSHHALLDYQRFLADPYGLVVTKGHRLAKETNLRWDQLTDLPLVSLTPDSGIRAQFSSKPLGLPEALNLNTPFLEVSNTSGLAEMITNDLGVSILPELAASTKAFADLCFIELSKPRVERELFLITRYGRSMRPPVLIMIDLILQQGAD